MKIVAKIFMVLLFLTSAMPLISQENNCASAEERYEQYKNDPELGPAAKTELSGCYREQIRAALNNHECQLAVRYYEKYTELSGKTDPDLERRINECLTSTQFEPGNEVKPPVEVVCMGTLLINGNEALLRESKVYFDDVRMNNPPINTKKSVECGSHKIRIVLEGRKSFEKWVLIEKDKLMSLAVRESDMPFLVKYGYLQFNDPVGILYSPGCKVLIDGEQCKSPKDTQKLKTGSYSIRIEHPDYEAQTGIVTIEQDKTILFTISMTARTCNGYLMINSDKNSKVLKEASVYIDDEKITSFPIGKEYKLSCGAHSIRIEHEEYNTYEADVTISSNNTTIVVPVLQPAYGYLKLEGDSKILSKAEIEVGGDRINPKAIDKPLKLKKGLYVIKIKHEKYENYRNAESVRGGDTTYLRVKLVPKYVTVTLEVDGTATISIDLKEVDATERYGTTSWTGELLKGKHLIICSKKGRRDAIAEYTINETTKKIKLTPPTPYENFVTGNIAFNNEGGGSAFGITYGRLLSNHFGLYASTMWNFGLNERNVEDCDKLGFLINGTLPGYVDTKVCRWSLPIVGGFLRLGNFYLKAGIGRGARHEYWQATNGLYYHNLGYSSRKKWDYSAGIQYHIVGRYVASFDMVTNDSKTVDFKFGLGVAF